MKNDIPIYAIDFEGSKRIGIIEFGAVGIFEGELFFAKSAICKPVYAIDKKSEILTGISNEKANSFAPFESFENLFVDMRKNGFLAAHNHSAEDSMLRAHIPTPNFVPNFFTGENTLTWAPWLDSINFAKYLDANLQSLKLADTITSLGLQEELDSYAKKICNPQRSKWHCALYDALASAIIIRQALKKIKTFAEFKNIALRDNQENLPL